LAVVTACANSVKAGSSRLAGPKDAADAAEAEGGSRAAIIAGWERMV
jgi:hypothetical protein